MNFIIRPKILILSLLILTIFAMCGCNNTANTDESVLTASLKTMDQNIDCLDSLIRNSDVIVISEVTCQELYDATNSRYTATVNKWLKGAKNEESIHVYAGADELAIGKSYLLFLDYRESELYEKPLYSAFPDKTSIVEISSDNTLLGNEKYTKSKNKTELITYIENSPNLKVVNSETFDIIDKAENTQELYQISDYVAIIKPYSCFCKTKYVKAIHADIIAQYKGQLPDDYPFLLPFSVEIGEEYLMFLKNENEYTISLSTRHGSIISQKDPEAWEEAINVVKEIQSKL